MDFIGEFFKISFYRNACTKKVLEKPMKSLLPFHRRFNPTIVFIEMRVKGVGKADEITFSKKRIFIANSSTLSSKYLFYRFAFEKKVLEKPMKSLLQKTMDLTSN